ncbi:prealbumin-like fold domain-containing protein [Clostridium sp. BJN0001]|uniref:prealbumin-like fold domain-containing protein n=1 Tax=Clostridium sp. BJN0001 TaxID=2930219 RepID=UPI001FD39FEC|nr:prealbumin-like fold domain-containing protein [Clostridium sp. BJN0001]
MANDDKNKSLKINLSAGEQKIKYYGSSDNNCIFEILDDDDDDKKKETPNKKKTINQPKNLNNNRNNIQMEEIEENKNQKETQKIHVQKKENKKMHVNKKEGGKIHVKSILDCGHNEYLEGVKINLYRINGLNPSLVESKITDKKGNVDFLNLPNGSYRVIEIIDKRYFEKPKYNKWNEINIGYDNRESSVIIINKIKRFYARKNGI